MKHRYLFIISIGLTTCLYLLFVAGYWNYINKRENRRVANHSRVIASAIWNYEPEGVKEYLSLACGAYNYKRIVVNHSMGEPFIEVNHTFENPVDKFFISMNFFPSDILVSDIIYDDKVVGRITVNWYNTAIYIFIYSFMVCLLVLLVLSFYLRNLKAKKELEIRVEERTKHLKQEISERKQVEKNLKTSESFLNSVVENIPNMIFVKDTKDLRFIKFNKAGEELLGYPRESLIGKNDYDLFPKKEADFFTAKDREVIASKILIDIPEELIQTKNKGNRTLHTKKIPLLGESGEPLYLLGISEDITVQKQNEKELLKIIKLESVGLLAGGIAHDFNNILTAILGNINLALFDESLSDRTQKLLAEAEKASLRAKDLTQQLLTFAKGGEPVKEVFSLENVIKDSANFVLRGDKVVCRYNFSSDLWLVEIDQGQISQVIQNFVLNASHAMPGGGVINVSCDNAFSSDEKQFAKLQKGMYVKISIEDSGIGIPTKILEKIFDPYFSTKQEGSGLGLAISQSIISKHGGHVSVKSRPGEGSTFTIYLPASTQIKTQDQKPDVYEKVPSHAKVLVMDDEDMVNTIAKEMLIHLGHEVHLVKSGEKAIKLYKESINANSKFNFVVMDLTIPGGMGGVEAVKEILLIDPSAKVIVSSGYSNDPIMANFKDYGFCAAIAKPFQLQTLSSVLSKVFN